LEFFSTVSETGEIALGDDLNFKKAVMKIRIKTKNKKNL